jgi:hypothetical protein
MKFMMDIGTNVYLMKYSSLKLGTKYDASKGIQIKGIFGVESTLGFVSKIIL